MKKTVADIEKLRKVAQPHGQTVPMWQQIRESAERSRSSTHPVNRRRLLALLDMREELLKRDEEDEEGNLDHHDY